MAGRDPVQGDPECDRLRKARPEPRTQHGAASSPWDSDGAPVVGAFRMVAVKRPQIWVEAARLISARSPRVHFVIIGDGPLSGAVAELAAECGLSDRFHLPGRVSNVGDWYRTMDVMLLTSRREGTPNVIIQAQHFGIPSVVTDVGGVAEVVAAWQERSARARTFSGRVRREGDLDPGKSEVAAHGRHHRPRLCPSYVQH